MAGEPGSEGPPKGGNLVLRGLAMLDSGIARIEAFVLAYGVLLMAANTIANVISRSLFGQSLYFTEELNRFLIVLVTFMGLGYAARKGRHIRMSALYDQLPDTAKKVLMVAISVVTAAVMFLLAYYSYRYVLQVQDRGRVTPALRLPLYLTYIWVPVGFVITGIQFALTAVKNVTEKEVYISYEEVDVYDEVEQPVSRV